ncbi:MAG: type II toxin-antitoxin system VapC family toxin [Isosphaeraceae bacterium]
MPRYLFDTDHLTLFQHGQILVVRRRASHPPGSVGISVVTIEEAMRGRLAALARAGDGPVRIQHDSRLTETLQLFAQFPVVPYDQPVEDEFQRLSAVRIGTQDRKIAAVALANPLTLVTANRRDFARVPGLTLEDWSV